MVCTVLLSAAVNLLFYDISGASISGDDGPYKELCEGPSGTVCTAQYMEAGACSCHIFDCESEGCEGCTVCDSAVHCFETCDTIEPQGILPAIVTALILNPLVLTLNQAFKWLHAPETDAIVNHKHVNNDDHSVGDDEPDEGATTLWIANIHDSL